MAFTARERNDLLRHLIQGKLQGDTGAVFLQSVIDNLNQSFKDTFFRAEIATLRSQHQQQSDISVALIANIDDELATGSP